MIKSSFVKFKLKKFTNVYDKHIRYYNCYVLLMFGNDL